MDQTKLLLMNAIPGGSIYPNCTPFAVDDVMKHLGLYIFHIIAPSPQVEMKFQSTKINEANGNDLINEVFGRRATIRQK